MVAVPVTLAIQRDDQQVGPLQRRKDRRRAAGLKDRVAQRPRQVIQHRGPGQERHPLGGEVGQQLGVQVVGQEPIVAGKGEPGGASPAAGLVGQGGQVQGHRPALGTASQLGHLGIGQLDPGRAQQRPGLHRAHRQLPQAQLGQATLGPPARHRQRRLTPAGHRQLRSWGQVVDQHRQRVQALLVLEQVHIVQDHHHRMGLAGQGGRQPGQDRLADRGPPGGQHAQHPRIDRLHPVQPNREIGQQHGRVVVVAVDRQPDKGPRVPLGPLGGQHGLAVPGGPADDHHRRGRRGLQPVQKVDPGHDPGTRGRRGQLRLNDREGRGG